MNAITLRRWAPILAVALATAWPMGALSAPPGPKPVLLISDADQWWLMDAGRTVAARKGEVFYAGVAAKGSPVEIHRAKEATPAKPIDDVTLGFQASGSFRTLNVVTGKVATPTTAPARKPEPAPKAFPLTDGKGRILEEDGTIFLIRGARKGRIFRDEGQSRILPDRAQGARLIVIERVVDSNKDGRVDRATGDYAEVWVIDLARPDQRIRIVDSSQECVLRGWTPDGQFFLLNRVAKPTPAAKARQGDLMVFSAATKAPMRLQPGPNTNYVWYHGYAGPGKLVISFDNIPTGPKQKEISQFALLQLGEKTGISLLGQAFPSRPACAVGPGLVVYALKDSKTGKRHVFRVTLPAARPSGEDGRRGHDEGGGEHRGERRERD